MERSMQNSLIVLSLGQKSSVSPISMGLVDELISTHDWIISSRRFAIFGDRMKAIELCVNRFDEDTKASFMDLYTKVDEDVKVPMGLEEVSEENESEVPF